MAETSKPKQVGKGEQSVKAPEVRSTKSEIRKGASEYSAAQITVLEGLDPVRKRPGMYIGGTGIEGLHHLVWEVVDNAIDEAMAGHADWMEVKLLDNNEVEVSDNGRGIPVDVHPATKKSALETVLTTLHAGGKFGGGGYKVSGGLHGVGVSIVNALSEYVKAEVVRGGKLYMQEYFSGKPKASVKSGPLPDSEKRKHGTTIRFRPDPKVFPVIQFFYETIRVRLREQAYLTKGITISLQDLRSEPEGAANYQFFFEGGVVAFVRHLSRHKTKLFDPPFYVEKPATHEGKECNVEVALQYTDDFTELVLPFANNIHTPEGGTHITGFRTALTRAINEYARKNNLLKAGEQFTGDDAREGLVAVVSVKLEEPQFEGQTKSKLGNPEVQNIVQQIVDQHLTYFLDEHPSEARRIIEKVALSLRARLAAKAARETVLRKGVLDGLTLPGKLADCSERDPMRSELLIVEGDSAGGSAMQGRDRRFQAVLPLRGKILNVERARIDKMLTHEEIKALIVAMGVGIGDQLNFDKLRYGRILIMTDADVDGSHIRTLLLTFFYRNYKELIDRGHIYIAQPPLYQLSKGKASKYAYTDAQRDAAVAEFGGMQGVSIQRYKGLGEMNPDQLWDTTLNPEHRHLLQVTIEDAGKADDIFSMLMGDEVAPRKRFIQTHAKSVKNLDI